MAFLRSIYLVVLLDAVAVAAAALLAIPHLADLAQVKPVAHRLFRYQLFAWVVALSVFIFATLSHLADAIRFLSLNRFTGEMAPVRWLLIKDGENWSQTGLAVWHRADSRDCCGYFAANTRREFLCDACYGGVARRVGPCNF
jgi:hypothetical protein